MSRLRFLRKSLNLTQKDIADILGVTQGAYSAIEIGRNELTDRNAEILSNKFGINKTWLLTGLGDMRAGFDNDEEIDREIAAAVQELAAEGKPIGGHVVPYEFVQQLFKERELHDQIVLSQQKTIEKLTQIISCENIKK